MKSGSSNKGGPSHINGDTIRSSKRRWVSFTLCILFVAWNAYTTNAWLQNRRNTGTSIDPSSSKKESSTSSQSQYQMQQQQLQQQQQQQQEEEGENDHPSYMIHNLASNHELQVPPSTAVTPVFYHIPKTGGTSIKNMYGECYDQLILATEVGILNGHEQDESLAIVNIENLNGRYVNVDTTTSIGIDKAASFQLVPSHTASLIVTPLLHESISKLFSQQQQQQQQQRQQITEEKARLFTVLRHPIDRQISLFYYLQTATWEPTFNVELQSMTLQEYVNSTWVEENYMVRSLVNKMEGPLDEVGDFNMAKQLLHDNFLVGILEYLEESIKRFDTFFGWEPTNIQCQLQYLQHGVNRGIESGGGGSTPTTNNNKDGNNGNQEQPQRERPAENSAVYQQLQEHNRLDIALYEYAKNELFPEQAALIQQQQQSVQ